MEESSGAGVHRPHLFIGRHPPDRPDGHCHLLASCRPARASIHTPGVGFGSTSPSHGRPPGAAAGLSSAGCSRSRICITLRTAMYSATWFHTLTRTERWRQLRRPMVWFVQICTFSLCALAAFLLRFEFAIPNVHHKHLYCALLVWFFQAEDGIRDA